MTFNKLKKSMQIRIYSYFLLSNCRGGHTNFQIFSSDFNLLQRPICEDFERKRPPWLLPTPNPKFNWEHAKQKVFCSSTMFFKQFFLIQASFESQWYPLKNKNIQFRLVFQYLRLLETLFALFDSAIAYGGWYHSP